MNRFLPTLLLGAAGALTVAGCDKASGDSETEESHQPVEYFVVGDCKVNEKPKFDIQIDLDGDGLADHVNSSSYNHDSWAQSRGQNYTIEGRFPHPDYDDGMQLRETDIFTYFEGDGGLVRKVEFDDVDGDGDPDIILYQSRFCTKLLSVNDGQGFFNRARPYGEAIENSLDVTRNKQWGCWWEHCE